MNNISSKDLRRAADLKDKIESLQSELSKILSGGGGNGVPSPFVARRGKIARGTESGGMRKRRKMSAAGRARIAAAARARWAKAKKAGNNRL